MSKPAGYIVRPKDMKALVRQLNCPQASLGELYSAARTLIGWAEPVPEIVCGCGADVTPGHTHPLPLDEPVNVPADPDVEPQPYDMPSPEADALEADVEGAGWVISDDFSSRPAWTCPEDALDRIADLVAQAHADSTDPRVTWGAYVALADYVGAVLRKTGR